MEFWKRVCLEAKVEPPQEPIWKKLFEKTVIINDDLFAMVGKLNDLGYKTAIISNAEAPNAEYIDGHIKNNRPFFFNAYVLSCDSDIKAVKPNPEIYLKACKVLEIYPEELVFVDDRKENIQGAEKLGISGILHVNNKTTIKKISDLLEISLK
ncbi:HAD-IA family hydrolase [Candidatus Woesearchaeota archaeon]|nr:HAD-IA family hydrolase [Candidatus Woesearchaeota archaeon]